MILERFPSLQARRQHSYGGVNTDVRSSLASTDKMFQSSQSSSSMSMSQVAISSASKIPTERTKRGKHTVRFDLSRNIQYETGNSYSRQDLKDFGMWYTLDECNELKKDAVRVIRKTKKCVSQREDPSIATYLAKNMCLNDLVSTGVSRAKLANIAMCELQNDNVLEIRGIEHLILQELEENRLGRRSKLVKVVLSTQKETFGGSQHERDNLISRKSQCVSRPSKVFSMLSARLQWEASADYHE